MSREARLQIIEEIERTRGSRVICYLTGDRRGFETRIGADIFSFFYEHLSKMGSFETLDLLLYSTGGVTMAGFGLVRLIREFCKKFNVLIPFKAHSCATLIALGANEIIMGKLGQLSPVDPSVTSPYNPTMPGQGQQRALLPVSVEDVLGYFDLARKEAGLRDTDALPAVFQQLSSNVHPLALGSVYRAREQIGLLARTLLTFHMRGKAQAKKVDKIISILTKERHSHDYMISRQEAKNVIGLKVTEPPATLEKKIWELYSDYAFAMALHVPYSNDTFLGSQPQLVGTFDRAFIESREGTHIFRSRKEVKRATITQPGIPLPVEGFQERLLDEGWVKEG